MSIINKSGNSVTERFFKTIMGELVKFQNREVDKAYQPYIDMLTREKETYCRIIGNPEKYEPEYVSYIKRELDEVNRLLEEAEITKLENKFVVE